MRPPQVTKSPRPVWIYGRGGWTHGPLLTWSGDEYGRNTVLLRLPGQRAIVWAYRWCNDPDCCDRCPGDGYPHRAWVDNRVVCEHCNPGSTACRRCGALNYTCTCFDD